METLSSYKISWLVLKPITGIATKHDLNEFRKLCKYFDIFGMWNGNHSEALIAHFPSRDKAQEVLNSLIEHERELDKMLDKSYSSFIISDKQFGMIKNSIFSVMTKKQIEDSCLI